MKGEVMSAYEVKATYGNAIETFVMSRNQHTGTWIPLNGKRWFVLGVSFTRE